MSKGSSYTIIVGVDGSSAAREALRWGHWQAGLANGTAVAVMAWEYPSVYNWNIPGSESFADISATSLNTAIAEALDGASAENVRREIVQGHAAKALLEKAERSGADLLVVGNRGHGGFVGALLGSVSQHCVNHASCPVVVVRQSKR